MTNPLIDKYNEIYGKKEPLKMPHIKDYEGEETFADELKKSVKLTTYDVDDMNASFQQVAKRVKDNKAQVSSMSMEMDVMSGTKITFEVYVDT